MVHHATGAPDVVFWTPDRAGSRFYRCEQPARALSMLGRRTIITPVLCHSWVRAGTIVGQQISTPGHTEVWHRLAAERDAGVGPQRLVFDIDDDYFSVPDTVDGAHEHYGDPEVRDRLASNIALADLVTVCSNRQAELARKFNPNVRITPNTLPSSVVRDPRRYGSSGAGRRPVVVGWSGSPAGHHDLDLAADALRALLGRRNVRLHLVGIPPALAAQKGLVGESVTVTPWVTGTVNYLEAIDFDVWVAPYRDMPFNHAKFPTKAIESSVRGISLLASPVQEYAALADAGQGIVCVKDSGWREALEWITQVHRAADRVAEQNSWWRHRYITEANAPIWQESLVCGGST